MLPECSRPLLAALVCAALAAPLSACGDDSEDAQPATTQTTAAPAAPTALRSQLERELTELIEAADARVDPDCVIDELRTTLSNDVVEAATQAADRGEEIPQEAVDAAFAAGQVCAKR